MRFVPQHILSRLLDFTEKHFNHHTSIQIAQKLRSPSTTSCLSIAITRCVEQNWLISFVTSLVSLPVQKRIEVSSWFPGSILVRSTLPDRLRARLRLSGRERSLSCWLLLLWTSGKPETEVVAVTVRRERTCRRYAERT